MEEEFEFFEVDPETLDIMEGKTNSNHIVKHPTTGDEQPKSMFLPPVQWIKWKQAQKDQLIAKWAQEHLYDKPF
jgi:hypothetical protein